ncbi:unnamed protein product [Lactuca saligna]|uniref:Uncharacterized protein n=1 Tax=Lactuca saligna TaxID=75948 RepID=A0AA35YAH9_LACSI|nr:unnamed protein product [Lactuca saligna]
MAMSSPVVVSLKTLFSVLAVIMLALAVWGIGSDGLASCVDIRKKWVLVTIMNYSINLAVILAWIVYKESSWMRIAVLIPSALYAGSTITSAYIATQFFLLSPQESSKDPLYFVLMKRQKEDAIMGYKWGPSVLTTRVIISALGCLMLGTFVYVLIVDGSQFHSQLFSACGIASWIDISFMIVTLSVWVAYKESSWISAFFWILSLVCFGSIGTCVYIVVQLFYLSPQQPVSLVLFNSNDKHLLSNDPLLMAHTNA